MKDKESLYRQVLDHISEIAYQIEGDPLAGTVRFVSKQAEKVLGYRPEEFIQDPGLWFRLIHPEDVPGVVESTQQLTTSREEGVRVYRLRHKQRDEYRWFEDKVVPEVDAQGRLVGIWGVARDITARKRQELQQLAVERVRERVWRMQSTEDIFQVLGEIRTGMIAMGIPFQDCDINIVDRTADPPLVHYALTGEASQWERANEGWSEAVVDMWRQGAVDYRPDLLAEDRYQEREYIESVYLHPVRSVIDVPFSHGTLGVNSTRAHAFSPQDIAFLEELAGALSEGFQRLSDLERLARSEARYRSLVETPEFVVILLDPQGRYLYVSPQIENWTGYSPGAFYADHTLSLASQFIHPDDYPEAERLFQQSLRQGTPLRLEYRWRGKNGEYRWVLENLYPVRDASGRIDAFQIVVQDIDARKRTQQRLEIQHEVMRILTEMPTPKEAFARALRAICTHLGWQLGELWEVDAPGEALRRAECWYAPVLELAEFNALSDQCTFSMGSGLPGRVWASGEPLWVSDVLSDTNFAREALAARAGLHGALGLPLTSKERILGVMTFFSYQIVPPEPELLKALAVSSGQLVQYLQRRQAEETMRKGAEHIRALADALPDLLFVLDEEGRYVEILTSQGNLLYAPPERLLGLRMHEVLPKEAADLFLGVVRETIASGEPQVVEYELEVQAGHRYFEGRTAPLPAVPGEKARVVWVSRDITQRQQAEEALHQTNLLLSHLIETSSILFFKAHVDVEGWRTTYISSNVERLVGYTPEEVASYPEFWFDHIHPEDRSWVKEQNRLVVAEKQSQAEREYRFLHKNGSYRWIHALLRFEYDSSGKLVDIWGYDLDITARKEAEEKIQEVNALLERQLHYLEALYHLRNQLEKVRTAAVVIDNFGQGIIAAVEGKTAVRLIVKYDNQSWSFGALPAGESATYDRPLKWGGQQRGWLYLLCKRMLCKAEESILLDGGTALLEQMLEARELELQLLQSSRLVSLGQMAAGVAHELYQPLTAISATAEDIYLRLLDNLDLPAPQLREMMKDVLEVVERMGEVIEQLRAFSRDTAQEPGSRFSLNAAVQGALRLIRAQLKSHDIQLVLSLAEDLPLVEGHLHQLEQVVLNLLANARDALDERQEGGAKQVVVRTYAQGEGVVLEVADNGGGMEEEVRLQIFEPFFTTKSPDRGTGLGLSISYGIVRNHHGQITCDSRKGQGTSFQIKLPAARQR